VADTQNTVISYLTESSERFFESDIFKTKKEAHKECIKRNKGE